MAHIFLSDEWFTAALALRDEFDLPDLGDEYSIVMNQVITDTPFGADVEVSVDTSSGVPDVRRGHVEGADVTVTTDYATAKSVLVDQDPQAVMQAFMSGKIAVEGDMVKLMTMQASAASVERHPARDEIATRLKDITAL